MTPSQSNGATARGTENSGVSVKQAANRMNSGHFDALRRVASGRPMFAPFVGSENLYASTSRGRTKIEGTLRQWGAVSERNELTAFGSLLIDAYSRKWPEQAKREAL